MLYFLLLVSAFIPKEKPHFKTLSTDDGLSQNTVWAVAKDHAGFMWFGTSDGLNRFDGYHFITLRHDPDDPYSLSDNEIRTIFPGPDGNLWLGTSGGLDRLDPETMRVRRYQNTGNNPNSLSYNYVRTICSDGKGSLWVGTRDGLNHLDPARGDFTRYFHAKHDPQSLAASSIRALLMDRDGDLWVGTSHGVDRFHEEDARFEHFSHQPDNPNSLAAGHVRGLYQSRSGDIWVGSAAGLSSINPDTGAVRRISTGPEGLGGPRNQWLNHIIGGSGDSFWYGTKDHGLFQVDLETMNLRWIRRHHRDKTSLGGNNVVSLYLDQTGLMWVGTFESGVTLFNTSPAKFKIYDPELPDHRVLRDVKALAEDRDNRLWVGMEDGLVRYGTQKRHADLYLHDPDNPHSLSDNSVQSLAPDEVGGVWVGTYGGGLNRYLPDKDHFKRYPMDPNTEGALPNGIILDLFKDSKRRLWVGMRSGLALYRDATDDFEDVVFEGEDPSPYHSGVFCMMESADGVLWMGTGGSGLCMLDLDQGEFLRFRSEASDPNTLSGDFVFSMCEDQSGGLWFGTTTGLNRLDPDKSRFVRYNDESRFPDCIIYAMVPGPEKELWISTDIGVFRFEPATHDLRHFDVSDGLQSNVFLLGASLQSHNGEILLGGRDGLNGFFPGPMTYNDTPPPVVLTSLKVFDREMSSQGVRPAYLERVVLEHTQNLFSFEFAALDYHAPHKNRYAYQLEGFDPDWVYCENRRFAGYSNLPGGRYRFKVKAANNDGIWNENGLAVDLEIIPPFWQRPLFQGGLLLLTLCLAYIYHLRRLAENHRRNQVLDALVKEKNEELEQAKQKFLDAAHYSGIYEVAKGVLFQIRDQLVTFKAGIDTLQAAAGTIPIRAMETAVADLDSELRSDSPRENLIRASVEAFATAEHEIEQGHQSMDQAARELMTRVESMIQTITVQHQHAKEQLYTEELDVAVLLDAVVRLEQERIDRLGITVHTDYGVIPKVKAPRMKLMDALVQVVENSVEAFEGFETDQRRVTVSVRCEPEDHVSMIIQDTGMGIDPSVGDKIYNAGWTSKAGHSGFGLHKAANAMRQMEGTINAESAGPGQGVTITLCLPLCPKDAD